MIGRISEVIKDNILILDGGMGTMIQRYQFQEGDFRGREFINHPLALSGFNDILNLTKPSAIKSIHKQYLEAGANIITTNTFNSNSISMEDYGLENIEGIVERLNREGVRLVKSAINEYKKECGKEEGLFFAGGSVGPTNKSASMSPDITDPLKRNISFDKLYDAYRLQISGLIAGGADLLIMETFFDTLNLKAAINAANDIMAEKDVKLPILISATVSDNSGRILAGQSLQAFVASVCGYDNVLSIGLNCGFGPDRMKSFIQEINKINPHFTSCHPNAGLPNDMGCYNVSPEEFVAAMKPLITDGLLNIAGGCCGTTPAHIKALSEIIGEGKPRLPKTIHDSLMLSGLDLYEVRDKFLTVGERCNVAGSAKFLRLIKENALEEAAGIAKDEIEKGADVIDINMDDAMLDAKKEMIKFLRYILAEPEIAKVPFMIDSSKWEVIEAAAKELQGKGIVNSLSLKEGEDVFIDRARKVKSFGLALIVMAFDERGQADTYERKIEVCQRAYKILIEKCGFNPQDIIFDVNVMTIATGMREHARYAIDFIKTVDWVKKHLPGARLSGGVSNLSFAFRGKNRIREYMHVIFLHHARQAGLDMAIINPAQNTKYEEIPEELKEIIEDIIFDRKDDAIDRLIEKANEVEGKKEKKIEDVKENLTESPIEEILKNDLIQGELLNLEEHLRGASEKIKDPVKIIEGPLLEGMNIVGDLFGKGKMFLPQVVKTARSMKRAVEILTPEIERQRKDTGSKKNGKIVIATVKGDVHDIGKNIVATILACNNYDIIDLGIMVAPEVIVETALKEKPDIICLSGLITPSLVEMTNTVRKLSDAGISVPVMIGGAATSLMHTALRIAPEYRGVVLHMKDASQNPIMAGKLRNKESYDDLIHEIEIKYQQIRDAQRKSDNLVPYSQVLEIVEKEKRNSQTLSLPELPFGKNIVIDIPLEQLEDLINWKMFFHAWKLTGKYLEGFPYDVNQENKENWLAELAENDRSKAEEALQLYMEARRILTEINAQKGFDGKGIIRFERAGGDVRNIYVGDKIFPMLRQQNEESDFLSVSDFVMKEDVIGFFAVTAGNKIHNRSQEARQRGETYESLLIQTLADRLAEASAEWLQKYVESKYYDIKIRPAWGYPMLPDQTLILETQDFLEYDKIGVSLTENGALYPPASISGIYLSNPRAKYFMVGEIGNDQLSDYAARRNEGIETLKAKCRFNS
ncbi:MAG: methionine synthase [Muribaculaceae bacterium]|nr:methionine synthase [Muribaculaceae bacterium]